MKSVENKTEWMKNETNVWKCVENEMKSVQNGTSRK